MTLEESGPVAQLGERYNRTVEVRSSSLLRSTLIPIPDCVLKRQFGISTFYLLVPFLNNTETFSLLSASGAILLVSLTL